MALFAGIDVGGTNVKLGLCDDRMRPLARASIPTDAARGPADTVERIAVEVRRLAAGRAIQAAAAGVPGPLDRARRVLFKAINLAGWDRVPFPAMLAKALGVPAFMENDANCAAVGEYAAGAGRGAQCLVLYTLGTGVGGGIVIEGRLWAGANGAAGELGHMTIAPDGPRCGCGQRGCVEALASATAVARRYTELSRRNGVTARDIFSLARRGDRAAKQTVNETARWLGIGIATMLHVLHPDVVVISGGMAAGAGLIAGARAEVRRRVFPMYLKGLRIVRGSLGDDAGWIGAASTARERAAR